MVSGFQWEADDGARTRDPWLGKPMLYQLSYVRLRATLPPAGRGNDSSQAWPRAGFRPTKGANPDVRLAATTRLLQEVSALGSIPLTRREEGQTMTEYAVVLAIITPALILVFATIADAIVARLQTLVAFLT